VGRRISDDLSLNVNPTGPGTFLLRLNSLSGTPDEAAAARVLQSFSEQIKAMTAKTATMTAQQRSDRLKELAALESDLKSKIAALDALTGGKSDLRSMMNDRLEVLRAESQRLEMEQAAKEARRRALMMEVDRQRKEAQRARQEDPISQELEKLLDMRQREVESVSTRVKSAGNAYAKSEGEAMIQQAQIALSEAKIRLAERQAQLGKAGKGELLDRLSDELSMVSVDFTETELRLAMVRDKLNEVDPLLINADGLKRAMEHEPLLRENQPGTSAQMLRGQYARQLDDIPLERFTLKVLDVEVTQTGPAEPSAGRGGRRGGGSGAPSGIGRRGR
jgi:chromosome segregation ATPase